MPRRHVQNAPPAILHREDQGLLPSGAAFLFRGEGRIEEVADFARSPQAVVQLILRMLPADRQAPHDRMRRATPVHHVGMPGAVRTARAGRRIPYQGAVLPVDIRAGPLVTAAPAAQGDDMVVRLPFGERVVRRMEDDDTAAPADKPQERLLHRGGPGIAVIVQHHETVPREVHGETGHVGAGLRRDGHVHPEQAGLLKGPLQRLGTHRPVVVVLPGDDHARNGAARGPGGKGRRGEEKEEAGEGQEECLLHGFKCVV